MFAVAASMRLIRARASLLDPNAAVMVCHGSSRSARVGLVSEVVGRRDGDVESGAFPAPMGARLDELDEEFWLELTTIELRRRGW